MAPEIIEMSAPPSAACDIWSLACTILELTTGKPPHFDLSPMAALFRIVQDDMPRVPAGASEALRDFLLQCFNREAALRADARSLVSHVWLQRTATQSLSAISRLHESGMLDDHESDTFARTSQSITCEVSNDTDSKSQLCNVIALKQYREVEDDDMEHGLAMRDEAANLRLKDARVPPSGCLAFTGLVLPTDFDSDTSEVNWDSDHENDCENDSIVSGLSVCELLDDCKSGCNIKDREREIAKREEVDILLFRLTMTGSAKMHDKSTSSKLIELLETSDGKEHYLSEVGAISLVESLRSPASAREALQAIQILLIVSSNAADVLVGMGIAPLLVSLTATNHTRRACGFFFLAVASNLLLNCF